MDDINIMSDTELRRHAPEAGDGLGAMQTSHGCLPLKAVAIEARIRDLIAETLVRQTFVNRFEVPLEAVYIFPLPPRAAVTGFRMKVGSRLIEATLLERGEARAAYEQALCEGHRAALTEQERQDVFTLSVGNLPPRETATIELRIVGLLPCIDGEATFRFPLVVAPRYIPGAPLSGADVGPGTAPDTDAVPDASRITPPVLLPGFPNPVELSLVVDLDAAGFEITDLKASLHSVVEERLGGVRCVRLRPGERLDRDFVLRFRIGAQTPRASLCVSPDSAESDEGTFALTLLPPTEHARGIKPRAVAFVLDRSGSMSGWKLVAARRALARMVDALRPEDQFTVLAFDNVIEMLPGLDGRALVPATDRHRFRAVEFLSRLQARGGTEMLAPLSQALAQLGAVEERERILILVTDGQVGNEAQILQDLDHRLAGVRILTVGIDQAVNAGFLERLARMSGGHAELVESEDRLDEVLGRLQHLFMTPVLSGIQFEPQGFTVVAESVAPAHRPELFASVPIVVTGRYTGKPTGVMITTLTEDGSSWETTVSATISESSALAAHWAKAHLLDLEDRFDAGAADRVSLERQIVDISTRYKVLSRFTAYVAIDRRVAVDAPDQCHQIIQPVDLPAGWNADVLGSGNFLVQPTIASRPTHLKLLRRPTGKPDKQPQELRSRWLDDLRAVVRDIHDRSNVSTPALDRLESLRRLAARLRRLLDVAPALGVLAVDLELVRELLGRIERTCELLEELMHRERDLLAAAVAVRV